ncbi:uncharacterized protein LOC143579890 [Bidens hawaiensis]|uniref:uncharacterized protein LOC143579890 n=1 Tax=Bidens hawaiensis TaxID=980011 RepID=UPI0040496F54
MADANAVEAKISIKVIIDKVNKRAVYAEADHTFVDILLGFITLPLGTIVRILGKHDDKKFEVLGSLNNMYQSLNDIPECYLATEGCKYMLLNPGSISYDHCKNLKLKIDDTEPMNGSVFVSEIATFIVTDDFSVMPSTTAGSIQLLTDLGITDMSHLEEMKLDMGWQQMVCLLKMALSLDSPLTHLVLDRNIRSRVLDGSYQGTHFDHFSLTENEASECSKMLLEVSLQKSTGKVLFAEAREDFVDFLFGFLSIPLGTVIGTLMNGASSLTCMDNIIKSVSHLSVGIYLKSQDLKDMLLEPHFGQQYSSKNQLFLLAGTEIPSKMLAVMNKLQNPRIRIGEGFLLKPGVFFVTDDLVITPSSSYSTMDTIT